MQLNGEESRSGGDRSRRIRFLRRAILVSIVAACLIPTSICLILAIKYDRVSNRLKKATEELSWYEQQYGDSALAKGKGEDKPLEGGGDTDISGGEVANGSGGGEAETSAKAGAQGVFDTAESNGQQGDPNQAGTNGQQGDPNQAGANGQQGDSNQAGANAQQGDLNPEDAQQSNSGANEQGESDTAEELLAENPDEKREEILENAQGSDITDDDLRRVYITFDDGPSSRTNDILDVLDEYGVKATFFVTGKPDSKYTDVYKRIVDDGHTLGMHSYSHRYSELYESLSGFQTDLHKLQTFLYETTGAWSTYYRFPGGSSNTVSKVNMKELINYLELEKITYYDWNVASGDDRSGITSDMIVSNVMTGVPKFENSIILLHDASDKQATVDALPQIIEQVQALENTVIVPITEDTLPVQHISNE